MRKDRGIRRRLFRNENGTEFIEETKSPKKYSGKKVSKNHGEPNKNTATKGKPNNDSDPREEKRNSRSQERSLFDEDVRLNQSPPRPFKWNAPNIINDLKNVHSISVSHSLSFSHRQRPRRNKHKGNKNHSAKLEYDQQKNESSGALSKLNLPEAKQYPFFSRTSPKIYEKQTPPTQTKSKSAFAPGTLQIMHTNCASALQFSPSLTIASKNSEHDNFIGNITLTEYVGSSSDSGSASISSKEEPEVPELVTIKKKSSLKNDSRNLFLDTNCPGYDHAHLENTPDLPCSSTSSSRRNVTLSPPSQNAIVTQRKGIAPITKSGSTDIVAPFLSVIKCQGVELNDDSKPFLQQKKVFSFDTPKIKLCRSDETGNRSPAEKNGEPSQSILQSHSDFLPQSKENRMEEEHKDAKEEWNIQSKSSFNDKLDSVISLLKEEQTRNDETDLPLPPLNDRSNDKNGTKANESNQDQTSPPSVEGKNDFCSSSTLGTTDNKWLSQMLVKHLEWKKTATSSQKKSFEKLSPNKAIIESFTNRNPTSLRSNEHSITSKKTPKVASLIQTFSGDGIIPKSKSTPYEDRNDSNVSDEVNISDNVKEASPEQQLNKRMSPSTSPSSRQVNEQNEDNSSKNNSNVYKNALNRVDSSIRYSENRENMLDSKKSTLIFNESDNYETTQRKTMSKNRSNFSYPFLLHNGENRIDQVESLDENRYSAAYPYLLQEAFSGLSNGSDKAEINCIIPAKKEEVRDEKSLSQSITKLDPSSNYLDKSGISQSRTQNRPNPEERDPIKTVKQRSLLRSNEETPNIDGSVSQSSRLINPNRISPKAGLGCDDVKLTNPVVVPSKMHNSQSRSTFITDRIQLLNSSNGISRSFPPVERSRNSSSISQTKNLDLQNIGSVTPVVNKAECCHVEDTKTNRFSNVHSTPSSDEDNQSICHSSEINDDTVRSPKQHTQRSTKKVNKLPAIAFWESMTSRPRSLNASTSFNLSPRSIDNNSFAEQRNDLESFQSPIRKSFSGVKTPNKQKRTENEMPGQYCWSIDAAKEESKNNNNIHRFSQVPTIIPNPTSTNGSIKNTETLSQRRELNQPNSEEVSERQQNQIVLKRTLSIKDRIRAFESKQVCNTHKKNSSYQITSNEIDPSIKPDQTRVLGEVISENRKDIEPSDGDKQRSKLNSFIRDDSLDKTEEPALEQVEHSGNLIESAKLNNFGMGDAAENRCPESKYESNADLKIERTNISSQQKALTFSNIPINVQNSFSILPTKEMQVSGDEVNQGASSFQPIFLVQNIFKTTTHQNEHDIRDIKEILCSADSTSSSLTNTSCSSSCTQIIDNDKERESVQRRANEAINDGNSTQQIKESEGVHNESIFYVKEIQIHNHESKISTTTDLANCSCTSLDSKSNCNDSLTTGKKKFVSEDSQLLIAENTDNIPTPSAVLLTSEQHHRVVTKTRNVIDPKPDSNSCKNTNTVPEMAFDRDSLPETNTALSEQSISKPFIGIKVENAEVGSLQNTERVSEKSSPIMDESKFSRLSNDEKKKNVKIVDEIVLSMCEDPKREYQSPKMNNEQKKESNERDTMILIPSDKKIARDSDEIKKSRSKSERSSNTWKSKMLSIRKLSASSGALSRKDANRTRVKDKKQKPKRSNIMGRLRAAIPNRAP